MVELSLGAKIVNKRQPKNPARGPDITIEYAGAVIMVAPRSAIGPYTSPCAISTLYSRRRGERG
jgi:hypothetical protein